jgi:hypothetical protein
MRRWAWIILRAALCFGGAQLLACDQREPIDQNFDSSLGADFRAPPEDASVDAAAADGGAAPSP